MLSPYFEGHSIELSLQNIALRLDIGFKSNIAKKLVLNLFNIFDMSVVIGRPYTGGVF